MEEETERISVRILGHFSAHLRGRSIAPSAAKQRQILALLALNSGRVVTVAELLKELWGDSPPRSCTPTLQTYILQLRHRLAKAMRSGQDARQVISTHHGGYMLDSAWCTIDAVDFESMARLGRAAAEGGDYLTASEKLSEALELWQGPALTDVPIGEILELDALSLEEKRLSALERRIEADIALHRHGDVLGDLRVLTAQHPMNENLSGFLMIALYRSGHVARALEEFQRLRAILHCELGIDPSPKLEQLHQSLLARDPALEIGPAIGYRPPLGV